MKGTVALISLALAASAAADPKLAITHEPPPHHLRMRPRAATAVAPTPNASARAPTPMPAAPPPLAVTDQGQAVALRDIRQPVSFSLDVGYQVEEANVTGKARLDARAPQPGRDFAVLRSYGFGEAFVSTRGVGLASLETYFAARFQIARKLETSTPTIAQVPVAPPIATWFERTGGDLRYGWGELRDFLPKRWGLSRLRVRLGGQHVYGPWVVHLDGALIGYDGKIVTASLYAGARHSDYTQAQPTQRPTVLGASMRFDLRGLPRPLPIALQGELLRMGASTELAAAYQPASESAQLQADWRPRQDVAVIGQIRALDRKLASQRLEVRARYRLVTNFVFDVTRREQDDWRWDPSLVLPDPDPTAARRYLDLGPVVPQVVASARAGTLIAENIDLYARGAMSLELANKGDPKSTFAAPYLEAGGAIEIRVRRTLAIGASVLTRQTHRDPLAMAIEDQRATIQMLPTTTAAGTAVIGESGFTEVGTSARMSLGARRFSALVEVYGRRTHYPVLYLDPILPVPTNDVRGGGRFTVDAWVNNNLRLFAAFDVSSSFDFEPDITGYKSLRLMMSGVY